MPSRNVVERPVVRRGRPRKFVAPSRALTLTLPEQVIEALSRVDADLGRAIVRLAQPVLGSRPHPPAEVATFGRHSVIIVTPSRTLERRTGVDLLRLPDGRALISFNQPTTIADLELHIQDALDDRSLPQADRDVFESIRGILRSARRSDTVALRQRNVIVLESRSSTAHRAPRLGNAGRRAG